MCMYVCMYNNTQFTCMYVTTGALAVTLSSNPDVTATTVCPSTNVTFTCFVEQTIAMRWEVGGIEVREFSTDQDVNNIGIVFVVDNVFLVTLINISSVSNGLADFTSTLKVSADEVDGTTITCRSFSDMQSTSLVIASKFHFVSVYYTSMQ